MGSMAVGCGEAVGFLEKQFPFLPAVGLLIEF
jgi:hypothetical protein